MHYWRKTQYVRENLRRESGSLSLQQHLPHHECFPGRGFSEQGPLTVFGISAPFLLEGAVLLSSCPSSTDGQPKALDDSRPRTDPSLGTPPPAGPGYSKANS